MSLSERSEIQPLLFKLSADLGVLRRLLEQNKCLCVAVKVESAQREINDALEEFKPEAVAN